MNLIDHDHPAFEAVRELHDHLDTLDQAERTAPRHNT